MFAYKTRFRNLTRSAFTLIELLIVVAIIGIVAAIALNNFQTARIKAMVARVQGDMRVLEQAAKQYKLDNQTWLEEPCNKLGYGTSHSNPCMFNMLTTPITYLTSPEVVDDPFQEGYDKVSQAGGGGGHDGEGGRNVGFRYGWYEPLRDSGTFVSIISKSRQWDQNYWNEQEIHENNFVKQYEFCIVSRGPDYVMSMDSDDDYYQKKGGEWQRYHAAWVVYDPSNGTKSPGDIMRIGK